MKPGSQFLAAAEIGGLAGLFWLTIWEPARGGVSFWNILAACAFISVIVVSIVVRKPSLQASGFRFDNIRPAMLQAGLFVACVVLGLLLLAGILGLELNRPPIGTLLDSLAFGIFQQALFLGYLFHRWNAWLRSNLKAAMANSIMFGIVHFPDMTLVAVSTVGELFFCWLFVRERSVWAVGVVHGVLVLLLLPMLHDAGAMKSPRIGPPALASFAAVIDRMKARVERIGLCSKVIGSDQLGPARGFKLQRVLRGKRSDREMRKVLAAFFNADGSALCITTEREFYRNLDPTVRNKLVIFAQRYIWRNPENMPLWFAPDPVLGFFRDRAILVGNRPPPAIE